MKALLPVSLAICVTFTGCLPPPPPHRVVAHGYYAPGYYAPGYYYRRHALPPAPEPAYVPLVRGPRLAPAPVVRPPGAPFVVQRRVVPGVRPVARGVVQPRPGVRAPVPGAPKPKPGPRKLLPGERPPPV